MKFDSEIKIIETLSGVSVEFNWLNTKKLSKTMKIFLKSLGLDIMADIYFYNFHCLK